MHLKEGNDEQKVQGRIRLEQNLRNRQRQPTESTAQPDANDQLIDRKNRNRWFHPICERYSRYSWILFVIIILLVLYSFKPGNKDIIENDKGNSDTTFGNLGKLAESASEQLDQFDYPGSRVMNKYRAVFTNLGIMLTKADIKNGAEIGRVLFELSDDYKNAGKGITEFVRQADAFFESLDIEMSNIKERIYQKEGLLGNYFGRERSEIDIEDGRYIKERLRVLRSFIPDLSSRLEFVLKSFDKIEVSVNNTQDYLMVGEKEAQELLKEHWLGNIADYVERKKMEDVKTQVLYVLQLLREMLPNLYGFQDFLTKYDKRLQDLDTKMKVNINLIRPSKETFKYLEKAAEKLRTSHKNFKGEENRLGQEPKDRKFLTDEMNERNRDCTEFEIKFKKSDDVYLTKLRIWSSHSVNALAFFYSDGSSKMFGTPGYAEAFDFEWHKGEKIKRLDLNFAAVVYGFEITTTEGRKTGWHGGNGGQRFYTGHGLEEYVGLFGSFSKYICSLEVLL